MRDRKPSIPGLWALPFLASLLLVTGCFSRPKEQASPGELLILGQEDMKSERFESARQAFKRLLREYPDSKHRRDALLNLADSYYKEREYIEARVQYAEYVQLYPVSSQTPKAYFFLGMSDFQRKLEYDQNQDITQDALKSFQELVKRFPKSKHTADAKKKIQELTHQIARHKVYIARFYFRKGLRASAIPRFQEVVKGYPGQADLRSEAMFYLGECFRLEQSYKKAGDTYKSLIQEYPSSRFARDAYQRLLAFSKQ